MTEKEQILEKLRYIHHYTGHQKVLEAVNEAIEFIENTEGRVCLCPKCTLDQGQEQ